MYAKAKAFGHGKVMIAKYRRLVLRIVMLCGYNFPCRNSLRSVRPQLDDMNQIPEAS